MKRCDWSLGDDIYIDYHDKEWGVEVKDDHKLFEFLILEGMQAGLSWITILRKRENFRSAFDNFDYKTVANYNSDKIEELMQNSGIIRNRLKIKASIKNAKAFIDIQAEFGSFYNYIWSYVDGKQIVNQIESVDKLPASSELSTKISKDLKKRGMSFVGPTIIYSFLEATGVINDHISGCFRHKECTI